MTVRIVFIFITAFILSACDIEKAAEAVLPDHIEAHASETVDAVMANDAEYFAFLKPDEMSEQEFEAAIDKMLSYRSDGSELERHIVGASNNTSISSDTGKSRTVSVVYEVKTEDGFTLVSLGYAAKDAPCCELKSINVRPFETSPQYEPMKRMMRAASLIGMGLIIATLLGGLIIWRTRQRKGDPE